MSIGDLNTPIQILRLRFGRDRDGFQTVSDDIIACVRAKVEVRNVRGDIKEKLKKAIKDGLSEDNEKDAELELQKLHDKFIKKIDELIEAKNKEIMTV